MQNPKIIQHFPPLFVDVLFHGGDLDAIPQKVRGRISCLHDIGGDSVDGVARTDTPALASVSKTTLVFHMNNSLILRLILIVDILS